MLTMWVTGQGLFQSTSKERWLADFQIVIEVDGCGSVFPKVCSASAALRNGLVYAFCTSLTCAFCCSFGARDTTLVLYYIRHGEIKGWIDKKPSKVVRKWLEMLILRPPNLFSMRNLLGVCA